MTAPTLCQASQNKVSLTQITWASTASHTVAKEKAPERWADAHRVWAPTPSNLIGRSSGVGWGGGAGWMTAPGETQGEAEEDPARLDGTEHQHFHLSLVHLPACHSLLVTL